MMKNAKGTHKTMGKKGHASSGLETGLYETAKVGDTNPDEVYGSQRPKAQKHGSVAAK